MAKSNESLSLPKKKLIHGVEVKKMPCGKYFEALQTLKDLPQEFFKELMKDKKEFKLSEMMSIDGLTELAMRLLVIIPDFATSLFAILLDIEENKIRNQLTPKELVDILTVFWKINELESFFAQMKPIMSKALTSIGFKELLQLAPKSE